MAEETPDQRGGEKRGDGRLSSMGGEGQGAGAGGSALGLRGRGCSQGPRLHWVSRCVYRDRLMYAHICMCIHRHAHKTRMYVSVIYTQSFFNKHFYRDMYLYTWMHTHMYVMVYTLGPSPLLFFTRIHTQCTPCGRTHVCMGTASRYQEQMCACRHVWHAQCHTQTCSV